MTAKKILIYRLGSLGDTLVALPAFHLIARTFSEAERRVLTNFPVGDKEAHLSAILGESGLVHDYISYPLGVRDPRRLICLRYSIKRWKPDVLVYLAEPRGRIKAFRDALFFKSCGIKTLIGVPYNKSLQENRWLTDKLCYEHEAERIDRCLASIGDAQIDKRESWDLRLSAYEQERAKYELRSFGPNFRFIACSIGTKADVKDWGKKNWQSLVRQLSQRYRNYGLVLTGSKEEFEYSSEISDHWTGRKLNLCGMLTPRESAAVLKQASIFIGHDSGPMHLAASVGTRCVSIFSARDLPGIWFPYGVGHKVIYHKTDCFGCGLDVCKEKGKKCIASITVNEILSAVKAVLAENK